MENRIMLKQVDKLKVVGRIEDVKVIGEVIDRVPKTLVTFEVPGTPGQFDNIFIALSSEVPVSCSFGSDQAMMDLFQDAEAASRGA